MLMSDQLVESEDASENFAVPSFKLVIKINNISVPIKEPFYILVRVGSSLSKTKKYAKASLQELMVNETFVFHVSFHSQIFNFLTIFIIRPSRLFSGKVIIGKASIRLFDISLLPRMFTSWIEVFDSKVYVDDIGLPLRCLHENVCKSKGGIEVHIRHNFKSVKSPSRFNKSLTRTCIPIVCTEDTEEPLEMDEKFSFQAIDINYLSCCFMITPCFGELYHKMILELDKIISTLSQGISLSRKKVALSIILLSKFFRKLKHRHNGNYIKSYEFIKVVHYFKRFSMATFGWHGLNYFGYGKGYIHDMFRSDANLRCISEYLSINVEDILELNLYEKEVFRPSYFIAIDRVTNSIVLCIRGSMSIADAITDVNCEYYPYKNGMVHLGMFKASVWMVNNVMKRVYSYKEVHKCDKIIITGHSLGAAIASLIGMQINDTRDDVTCYCFGCPAVVSEELITSTFKNTFTFNYRNDVVSHLSYGSLMDFRMLLITSSKYVRMADFFKNTDHIPSDAAEAIIICREELKRNRIYPKLYSAGQFHSFYPINDNTNKNTSKSVVMERSSALEHGELMVLEDMFADHLPSAYENSLRSCLNTLESMG